MGMAGKQDGLQALAQAIAIVSFTLVIVCSEAKISTQAFKSFESQTHCVISTGYISARLQPEHNNNLVSIQWKLEVGCVPWECALHSEQY